MADIKKDVRELAASLQGGKRLKRDEIVSEDDAGSAGIEKLRREQPSEVPAQKQGD